jgi:ElaB/YqjD/DUF883 family membrane-anchored ribosome-binding protein
MGQDPRADGTAVTQEREPQEIQREIEHTRHELGDTVASLVQKADVKAQAKHKVEETKASAFDKKDELIGQARSASPQRGVSLAAGASQKVRENPLGPAAAAAFAAGFVIGRTRSRAK